MKFLISAVIAMSLALSACSSDSTMDNAGHTKSQPIMISDAIIMPPFPGRDTAASYFTIINQGADTKLLSVSSPLSERVEIHNHIEDNGVMKMRRVEAVDVARGQSLEFKPGSYHVMMFQASVSEDLKESLLTLTFDDGTEVTVTAPIEGREEADTNSEHDGH